MSESNNNPNDNIDKNMFHDLVHDIRSPITIINTTFEILLLKKCNYPQEKLENHIKSCKSQLEKIKMMLTNFTDMRRSSDIPVFKKEESINPIIQKSILAFEPRYNIEDKKIILNSLDITFNIDKEIFKQMIYNILEHAIFIMKPNTIASLSCFIDSDILNIKCEFEGGTELNNEDVSKIYSSKERVIDSVSGIKYNKGFGLTYNKLMSKHLGGEFSISFDKDSNKQILLLQLKS